MPVEVDSFVQQAEHTKTSAESKVYSLCVNRESIPAWPDKLQKSFEAIWSSCADWIMDTLEVDAFTLTFPKTSTNRVKIDASNGDTYTFNITSTWLLGCGKYFNYRLQDTCVSGCGLEKPTPSITSASTKIGPLDFNILGSCVLIQADCSMGKTCEGISSLIAHHQKINHSILLVTENIALSFHFQRLFPTFMHYQSLGDLKNESFTSGGMICQMESLGTLDRFPLFDVVVLDEITSCFSHVISQTMEKKLGPSLRL